MQKTTHHIKQTIITLFDQLSPRLNFYTIAGIVIFLYISYINIFVLTAEIYLMAIQFFIFIFIFMKGRSKTFIKEWLPFLAGFLGFEILRGFADNLSPFYHHALYATYKLEAYLFDELPTVYLQNNFLENDFLVQISTFFYSSFFYYSFLIGFLIWVFKRNYFQRYTYGFLTLSYVGVVFFFLLPTAPPWFIDIENLTQVRRVIWNETILSNIIGVRIFTYFAYANHVAALPSLHTGWTAFTSFFLIKYFGRKMLFTLIVPIMVGFSVVLTGEHFLLDVILGMALAYLAANGFFQRTFTKVIQQTKLYVNRFKKS